MRSLVAIALAFVVATTVRLLVQRFALHRVLDEPGHRSLHSEPRTRLGGLAVASGLLAGIAVLDAGRGTLGVAIAVVVAGAAGLREDVVGLGVGARLLAQVVAGALAAPIILEGEPTVAIVIGALWVVAFVNEFNFMDGVNGLSGLQLAVAGGTWMIAASIDDASLVQGLGAVAVGSAVGFLPGNFPRPRMFMGDVGAYAAGAFLATSCLVGLVAGIHPIAVFAPLTIVWFDTSLTLGLRLLRGENIITPHLAHRYQRTVLSGWSTTRVTALVTYASIACGALGLLALGDTPGVVVAIAGIVAVVAAYTAITARAISSGSLEPSPDDPQR